METIRELLTKIRQIGLPLVIGFILILYISLGIIYWQQTTQQADLTAQIAKLSLTLARPMPSAVKLEADYKVVNAALYSVNVSTASGATKTLVLANKDDAIELLVLIAEKSGINTDKLSISSPSLSTTNVGKSPFQLLSFGGIRVQGDNSNVMAFLADLDSGKTLGTMVLKRVTISYTVIPFTANETEQRDEFNAVALAVKNMMADNGLSKIPNPISFTLGRAANFMGDDPLTNTTIEGFPDNTTTITEKGYTVNISSGNSTSGNVLPRGGYVLYRHDKISADNISAFSTVSYFGTLKTKYYYTVEADGTVRQFSGPGVTTATEYVYAKGPRNETIASIDVDIYAIGSEKK